MGSLYQMEWENKIFMEIKNDYGKAFSFGHRNLALVYKSILVGLCAGFVTILYRIALTQAELWSLEIY